MPVDSSSSNLVDDEYRTRLGTRFYNREYELDRLNETVERYRVTVVYGPRNVGKSELVRYWAWKENIRDRLVMVEGDVLSSENILDGISWHILSVDEKARRILEEGLKAVAGRLGIYDIYKVVSRIPSLIGYPGDPLVIFIDEFHLLPRYHSAPRASRYEVALTDLEALAHYLSKKVDVRVRVVLTVSEGFVATNEAMLRLHGYSSGFLLIDHLDEKHFKSLFEEYTSKNPCPHDYVIVKGVIGGAPGYLLELCASEKDLESFIGRSKSLLEEGLSGVRNVLRDNLGWDPSPHELIENAYKLVCGKQIRPVEEPRLHLVGQLMTTHNLVYPVYEDDFSAIKYKPQIPVYRWILDVAVEKHLSSLLLVRPEEILARIRRGVSSLCPGG